MDSPGDTRYISGIKVKFPVKPYSSQILMMERIVKGIERGQNCLLESPTGSGKSLALLCSALAWQEAESEKAEKESKKQDEDKCLSEESFPNVASSPVGPCTCGAGNPSSGLYPTGLELPYVQPHPLLVHSHITANALQGETPPNTVSRGSNTTAAGTSDMKENPTIGGSTYTIQSNQNSAEKEDEDFRPTKKFRTPGGQVGVKRVHKGIAYEDEEEEEKRGPSVVNPPPAGPPAWTMQITSTVGSSYAAQLTNATPAATPCAACVCRRKNKEAECAAGGDNLSGERRKVPKIYFGTRTHKQISQIVHELGRTAYREAKMCILSSREHTCIHPEVSNGPNKNDGCREKLDHNQCNYFENVYRINQSSIRAYGLATAWDIEDFVGVCKKKRACPYYGARGLKTDAQIIFCPYNYLIDPVIRENMEIALEDQIVILDEAHNIEDAAREAASYSINQEQLRKAIEDIKFMVDQNIKVDNYLALKSMCESIQTFLYETGSAVEQKDFSGGAKFWGGIDMVARLQHMGIGPEAYPLLIQHFKKIQEEEQENKHTAMAMETPKLNGGTTQVLKGLFMVLSFVFQNGMKFLDDYKLALVKTLTHKRANVENQWLSKRRPRNGYVTEWLYSLNFWCLNPAVAFQELGDSRCVVLTSGTLSPMGSFQSELGIPFPIQLEASHVVGKKQVWVGTVTRGPGGHPLQATYQNTETFAFQDELGQLVLSVCQTVPHGVLVFVSSYNMLEKLKARWETTGVGSALQEKKALFCEPRASDKVDFDELMKSFYQAIEETADGAESGGQDGALFIAVCRGKVSEGLDFADNNARAVITVGIPFPNVKDLQVELKRNYNNQHHASRGLLTGAQWYEIQAYRALNQALGRCIRHIRDWGALILVDQRFGNNPQKYTKGLSKWVRQRVQNHVTFTQARLSLKEFTQSMIENPPTNTIANTSLNTSMAGGFLPSTQTPMSQEDPSLQQRNSLVIDLTKDENVNQVVEHSASPALKKTTPVNAESRPVGPQSITKTKQGGRDTKANMGQTFIGQYVLTSPAPPKGKDIMFTPTAAISSVKSQIDTPLPANGKPQSSTPGAVELPVLSKATMGTAVNKKRSKSSTGSTSEGSGGARNYQPLMFVSPPSQKEATGSQRDAEVGTPRCKLSLGEGDEEGDEIAGGTDVAANRSEEPAARNQEITLKGKLKDKLNMFRFRKDDPEPEKRHPFSGTTSDGKAISEMRIIDNKAKSLVQTSKRDKFYQHVNIPANRRNKEVEKAPSPEKQEESCPRFSCTPPLFDSESMDGFSAPMSLEGQDTLHDQETVDVKVVNEMSEAISNAIAEPDQNTIKKEPQLKPQDGEDATIAVSNQKDSSSVNTRTKRSRSLSRKRSVFKETNVPAKGNCTTEEEGNEDDTIMNRKKRSRVERKSESSKRQKSRDILDLVDCSGEQTDDDSCFQCKLCGADLCKRGSVSNKDAGQIVPEMVSRLSSGSENVFQMDRKALGAAVADWEGGTLRGVEVNSLWCSTDQCCYQYLRCASCKGAVRNKPVIGVHVVTIGAGSKYSVGQAWILSKQVK
ncbi:Fanconi anemia group J protein homolog [Lingula anatina]|uniref:DNA 5'-3' helicase n=1 Tax=Lingula anatina TaxID=7574 RepID=A0A1S3H1V2_LINAN|nr:Fanconi anemia group J protein homolog [Lingula anatina]XP_013379462.1 Fanconi anemia group J protein homolog [Lingula anatina]|eukprot:XP_013379461.1 Fanconi anemia group J protein homolog [Lingula anatina]